MALSRRDVLVQGAVSAFVLAGLARPTRARAALSPGRYLYVFSDGSLDVFEIGGSFRHVRHVDLPMTRRGTRGVCASAKTQALYVSYGGNGGEHGNGSLLRYDLRKDEVVWTRDYPFGIDSMAIGPAALRIYLPNGSLSEAGRWNVLDARAGDVVDSIAWGNGAHNTILSRDGKRLYMGSRYTNHLAVASTRTRRILRRIGPLRSGVRPFTISGRETILYTAVTDFLGFQVASLVSGRVLHTVPLRGWEWDPDDFEPDCPSHGISLSPRERELYVLNAPNARVHVFDVSGSPARAPRPLAAIRVSSFAELERPCAYACHKDGWLSHSRDGRFVFVGDAGDVIDTSTRRVVAHLEPLANTRKFIEVQFGADGLVSWAAPFRSSVGRVA